MNQPPARRSPVKRRIAALDTGMLAEMLVAQWLTLQGWTILQRRWRCRWGELDLVAYSESIAAQPQSLESPLIFVEVKARSTGNWDENGLMAITTQKQAKLWQAAKFFLSDDPALAELPCRFDVALVYNEPVRRVSPSTPLVTSDSLELPTSIELGQPVTIAGYCLTLQHYIRDAFEQSF